MCIYIYIRIYTYIHIYIYAYIHRYIYIIITVITITMRRPRGGTPWTSPATFRPRAGALPPEARARLQDVKVWIFITGCSQRGVQWIGVLYSKLVYNTIQITTPCFHCTPL